jgi:hypothetical protein
MTYEFQGRTQERVAAESGRRRGAAATRTGDGRRHPVQTLAAIVGATFLVVGIAGFIPGLTSDYDSLEAAGPESGAKLFGLFEVSVLHNIVHLLFAVGLIAAARYTWSRLYLIGGGIAYLGVVAYGFLVDHESDANFLPINDADNILHLVLGVGMIALGVLASRRPSGSLTS